ncbi:MAG TPA: biotin--[acetyl-CoA-carboxylase] ligase [Acidimicrobiia bacterium]|nr:biotin--[acetyl-CoA-carboxylase] ligase [Acidimicrobiia bacterium]
MPGGARISNGDGVPQRWRVEHFAELDSTNRYAMTQVRAGAEAGLVVVADHQTAGRGRLDRRWEAPPGSSLLVSVVLPAGTSDGHGPVAATAVALAEAVEEVAGIVVALKWPNDLVVGHRKLAGILAEAAPEADAVVVGAGCNVNWDAFPEELAGTATACNLESGRPVDRDALLDAFLVRLDRALDDSVSCAEAYRARLATLGRRVRVERASDALDGEAVALADDGALVVRDADGVDHVIVSGDVVHLRDAPT